MQNLSAASNDGPAGHMSPPAPQTQWGMPLGPSPGHDMSPPAQQTPWGMPRGPSSWPGVPQLPPGSGWGSWPQHQPPQ
jgi:hypothetical protein